MRSRVVRTALAAQVLTVLLHVPAFTQTAPVPPSRVFEEGEELVYNVRWGPFNLGQVRVKVIGTDRTGGSPRHQVKAQIDSYRGIPFVDLHAVFESTVDTNVTSLNFVGRSKEDEKWDFYRYAFQYDRNRVLIDYGEHDSTVAKSETLTVNSPYNDGLSLFFYARDRLFSGKTIEVPTLVKAEKAVTRIDFRNEHTDAEIDAVDYPVDVIKFEGNAGFTGLYGLTGDFEGWFSNDEARVPILAKMKVIIGKVTIELMEWKRTGWQPPRSRG